MRSFRRITLLTFCFALGLTALLSGSKLQRSAPGLDLLANPSALAQQPPSCPQFTVPAVTHGFTTTSTLPDGDLFPLPTPFTFIVNSPAANASGVVPGFSTFTPSPATFGGTLAQLGGFAGFNTTGFSFSTPNSSTTVISCLDSFWDVPFVIATSGATVGDSITFFLQAPPPSGAITQIGVFTIEAGGVRVTTLNSAFRLFADRLATGPVIPQGALIPLNQGAGLAGNRTAPLLLAFPMGANSPFMGCFFFGATIARGAGIGTTSLLITDVIVNRNEVAGDRTRPGTGLIGGLTGGFPTGAPCAAICAGCLPPLPQTPVPVKCDTVCFLSAEYWLLHKLHNPPGGLIFAYGVFGNRTINTGDSRALEMLLRGSPFGFGLTPLQRFNREFGTFQLNFNAAGGSGSPVFYNAMWANLSCYGITFVPVALSNGMTLTADSMVKDLYMQAQLAILEGRAADATALTPIFNLLNGNSLLGFCN